MGRHVSSAGFGSLRQQIAIMLIALALAATSLLYVVFADSGREGARSAGAQARTDGTSGASALADPTDRTDSTQGSRGSARPSPTDTASGSTPSGSADSSPTEEEPGSTSESDADGDAGTSEVPSPPDDPPSDVPDPPSAEPDPPSDPPSSGPRSPSPPTPTSEPEPTTEPPTPTSRPTAPSGDPQPTPTTFPPESPKPTKKPKPTHPVEVESYPRLLGGFMTIVTVENNSAASLTWELGLTYEEVDITAAWDAEVDLDGDMVTARGEESDAVLEPGEEAQFGFIAFSTPDEPISCTIAGAYCRIE